MKPSEYSSSTELIDDQLLVECKLALPEAHCKEHNLHIQRISECEEDGTDDDSSLEEKFHDLLLGA